MKKRKKKKMCEKKKKKKITQEKKINHTMASSDDVEDGLESPRRFHGSLLCPNLDSYESIGVCCSASVCFPCPVCFPCMWR